MGMKSEIMDTVKSCDMRNCSKNEKEGLLAAQISKWKKLNGRRYKDWARSLVKAKESDHLVQKESLQPQIDVNVIRSKDSSDKETTNTNSSLTPSELERVDFILRRVTPSSHATISISPDISDQTEPQTLQFCGEKVQINDREIRSYSPDPDDQTVHHATRCHSPVLADQTEVQNIEELVQPFEEENNATKTDFVEYWVPVRLSNIQIEHYCGSLFSNSTVLCSSSRIDPMKSLHEILVSTKKCCDHPYLVDWSLHTSLIKGIPEAEQLDAQIKLSSKLLLLHKALLEINKRGLRVLVLYQSLGGSGPITTGDILDDIIHERFGEDSFVRIDGNISRSKRQTVLDTFNEKDDGKFVCLMETRACQPSMKFKSLDIVIIFNSDWDPTNDLKALQKINLDPQSKQVKVFRLYSAYTIEEKVLMLTKQGMTPEGNIRSIKRSTCHELLTWGAYFLFQKLEEFHAVCTTDSESVDSHGSTSVEDVFHELSMLLPNNDNSDVDTKSSLILEVQQNGGDYHSNISLIGEVEYPLMDSFSLIAEMLAEEPPHVFWRNMLEGRNLNWKYFSYQSPKTRKNAQSPDELLEECVLPSKRFRTEAGSTVGEIPIPVGEIPTTAKRKRRRRRRHESLDECLLSFKRSRTEARSTLGEIPTIVKRKGRRRRHELLEECVLPSKRSTTEAGSTVGEIPTIAKRKGRRRRRQTSGEAAAVPGTPILDKTSSTELHSLSAPDDHVKVLESVCKALQTELDRLEKQKTESSKQHEDKQVQTRSECENEVAQIQKKYEEILHKADTDFLEKQQVLDSQYNKVLVNKALAEALMQRDATSSVAVKFSVEQACRLISQSPKASTVAVGSVASPAKPRLDEASCCLRAPAPHLRGMMHFPICTVPELSSDRPSITYSPVSLEKVTAPLPLLLPPPLPLLLPP